MYKLPVHPYVVRLLDHFENKEFIYLVLDKHPGNNLEEYLEENRNELKEKDFQIYAT
jgi:serine/threonine protein kinase